jgi:hypothetical protein
MRFSNKKVARVLLSTSTTIGILFSGASLAFAIVANDVSGNEPEQSVTSASPQTNGEVKPQPITREQLERMMAERQKMLRSASGTPRTLPAVRDQKQELRNENDAIRRDLRATNAGLASSTRNEMRDNRQGLMNEFRDMRANGTVTPEMRRDFEEKMRAMKDENRSLWASTTETIKKNREDARAEMEKNREDTKNEVKQIIEERRQKIASSTEARKAEMEKKKIELASAFQERMSNRIMVAVDRMIGIENRLQDKITAALKNGAKTTNAQSFLDQAKASTEKAKTDLKEANDAFANSLTLSNPKDGMQAVRDAMDKVKTDLNNTKDLLKKSVEAFENDNPKIVAKESAESTASSTTSSTVTQ